MFDLLKKKLGSFINRIASRGEQKTEEAPKAPEAPEALEAAAQAAEVKAKPAEKEKVKTKITAAETLEAQKAPEALERNERKLEPKLGLLTRLKALVSPEVVISEEEASPIWSELELALLESDVSLATTEHLIASIKSKIIRKRVARNRIKEAIREEIAFSLKEVFKEAPDLDAVIKKKKTQKQPAVLLFVGPNGHGKTTAIARLAAQLKQKGYSIVLAASDCFRAAAVEQLKEHADKIGVSLISRGYGVDPASVAFDAVAHAKSKGLDVVLVDTAGRQETSASLIREMEKMSRVLKPDLNIFVAEAIAGKSVVEQVKKFHEAIVLNGIILTKLDCDAKGGGALSIAYETGLPILFIGTGQGYGDFASFDADWIVGNVLAA